MFTTSEIAPTMIKKAAEVFQGRFGRRPWFRPHSSVILVAMWSAKIGRIAAVLLALTLAVGLVAHGVANPDTGLKSDMAAAAGKMPMSDTDKMPMSGKCDGCDDNSSDMAAACAAFCNSMVDAPVATGVIDVVLIGILRPSAGPAATGHVTPPEPYPPRPSSLS
jgi:hypothetical protein